ncbi:MarR family winged helix-turn-helix transcriptional regulator [Actinoalloteichus hymeniacidonis]|uniref:Transcriptional regulator n=1 Tax=Actinoalloteichus hymeniacidonis TaxID=340345 RepID=A0AAC9HQM5_9PSEU|nr:MarR family transcriptional regulator [Actinoalloteichus hymeniacidonis]AOS63625.1 transcriptional regulator [Actinoalloteichus hymeniacidonis]MBB5908327.1 DNA-binding MarR family transcriptional regulator [Actinoalloteichus hymeniacidonis]
MTDTVENPSLAEVLVQLSHLVDRIFLEVSRSRGLTPAQTNLLCILRAGPIGMSDLSRVLHLEKSSLTGLVDRVERRGLVARIRDTHDRRVFQIELTAQGRRVATEAHHAVTDQLERLAQDIPSTDRNLLITALGRLLPTA